MERYTIFFIGVGKPAFANLLLSTIVCFVHKNNISKFEIFNTVNLHAMHLQFVAFSFQGFDCGTITWHNNLRSMKMLFPVLLKAVQNSCQPLNFLQCLCKEAARYFTCTTNCWSTLASKQQGNWRLKENFKPSYLSSVLDILCSRQMIFMQKNPNQPAR